MRWTMPDHAAVEAEYGRFVADLRAACEMAA